DRLMADRARIALAVAPSRRCRKRPRQQGRERGNVALTAPALGLPVPLPAKGRIALPARCCRPGEVAGNLVLHMLARILSFLIVMASSAFAIASGTVLHATPESYVERVAALRPGDTLEL